MSSSSCDNNINNAATPILYIVYNAKSTLYGKLNYVYRKAICPDPVSTMRKSSRSISMECPQFDEE
jgi:hypothetical protein